MAKLTLSEAIARRGKALDGYANAVRTFRSAYVELGAMVDGCQGFGGHIDVVQLRHSGVNADEFGSLQEDILQIVRSTEIAG